MTRASRTTRTSRCAPPIALALAGALLLAGCGGVDPAVRAKDALAAGMRAHGANDYDTAARGYREVLHVDPDNVYAAYNLALAFEDQGDPSRAEYYYRIALGFDPDFVPALMNLGRLMTELGRVDDALGLTVRVTTIYPDYAPPLMRLAGLYAAAGRQDDADGSLKAALAADPAITDEAANARYGPADTGSLVMQAQEQLAGD